MTLSQKRSNLPNCRFIEFRQLLYISQDARFVLLTTMTALRVDFWRFVLLVNVMVDEVSRTPSCGLQSPMTLFIIVSWGVRRYSSTKRNAPVEPRSAAITSLSSRTPRSASADCALVTLPSKIHRLRAPNSFSTLAWMVEQVHTIRYIIKGKISDRKHVSIYRNHNQEVFRNTYTLSKLSEWIHFYIYH